VTEILKARLAADAASVELALAARNEQIRKAIAGGVSLRDIEAVAGIPRSTAQRIGAAASLTDAEYLKLANREVTLRSEVVALEAVDAAFTETDSV